jgi:hypothetical protein
MTEAMVSATAFSKAAGVTKSAISQAIKHGRIQAYSKSGRRVSAGFRGRKFLKLDEARQSFSDADNRLRIDDSFLAKESGKSDIPRRGVLDARARTSNLQAQLLELRLAREQGELIPRAASLAAAEALGRAVGRALSGIVTWSEENHRGGAGRRPGVSFPAFAGLVGRVAQFRRGHDRGRGRGMWSC